METTTLGVIVGNRDFFPDELCRQGRSIILRVLREEGFEAVCLGEEQGTLGSVQTFEDARQCVRLFRERAQSIDGVLVTLPNFGDERTVAWVLREARLAVPVLVHAFPDEPGRMFPGARRDAFCGKISVCNNLRQMGIAFTLTAQHVVDPDAPAFREDLRRFRAICRVVRGLRGARLGAIGARPAAFNTVRYSEKLLEASGISVETVDLSEVIARAQALHDDHPRVREKLRAVATYADASRIPPASLAKIAKLGVVIDEWVEAHQVAAIAVQCWSALERLYGVVPCTVMSMLSSRFVPSACEVDVTGALSMLALQLASGEPSALVDWNNNYGSEQDKAVVFHCSNFPAQLVCNAKLEYPPILASTLGEASTYGTISGRIQPGHYTFARISTDDQNGVLRGYVGQGEVTDDPLTTFGGYGVIRVPGLQRLLRYVCKNGFEHHVAMTPGRVGEAVAEALETYLGWEIFRHESVDEAGA